MLRLRSAQATFTTHNSQFTYHSSCPPPSYYYSLSELSHFMLRLSLRLCSMSVHDLKVVAIQFLAWKPVFRSCFYFASASAFAFFTFHSSLFIFHLKLPSCMWSHENQDHLLPFCHIHHRRKTRPMVRSRLVSDHRFPLLSTGLRC